MIERPVQNALADHVPILAPPVATEVERLTYRLNELAQSFGVSRRTLERAKSSGRLPKPDIYIGKIPLWRPETIQHWLDRGGN